MTTPTFVRAYGAGTASQATSVALNIDTTGLGANGAIVVFAIGGGVGGNMTGKVFAVTLGGSGTGWVETIAEDVNAASVSGMMGAWTLLNPTSNASISLNVAWTTAVGLGDRISFVAAIYSDVDSITAFTVDDDGSSSTSDSMTNAAGANNLTVGAWAHGSNISSVTSGTLRGSINNATQEFANGCSAFIEGDTIAFSSAFGDSNIGMQVKLVGTAGAPVQEATPGPTAPGNPQRPGWMWQQLTQFFGAELNRPPYTQDAYVLEPGIAGNNVSTPHDAADIPAGNMTGVVCVALDDWTPASEMVVQGKWASAANGTYRLNLKADRTMTLSVSIGGVADTAAETIQLPVFDGYHLWLKWQRTSGDGLVDFFYSLDGPSTVPETIASWVAPAGMLNRSANSGALTASTAQTDVGGYNVGATSPLAGKIFRACTYDGLGTAGTKLYDMNPADWVSGSSWVSSTTGETWTLNGAATVVKPAGGGGGTNWSQTITDAIGLLDDIDDVAVYLQTITDAIGILDSESEDMIRELTDAIGLLDSQVVVVGFTQAITDAVGLTDSTASDLVRPLTDAIGITDSQTPVSVASQTVTDAIGITDSRAAATERPLTDAVGITDSATQVVGFTQTVTDPVGVADGYGADTVRPLTDPVGITDSQTPVSVAAQTVTDAVGVTDSYGAATERPIVDPVGITDSMVQVTGFTQAVTDAIGITDTRAADMVRPITDAVGITDSQTPVAVVVQTVTDNVGIVDSEGAATERPVTDAVGLTDVMVQNTGTQQTFTDAIGITDSRGADTVRPLTDPIGITDSRTQASVAAQTVTDAVGIADSAIPASVVAQVITDALGITDSQSAVNGAAVTITDAIGIIDSRTQVASYVQTITDALGMLDSTAQASSMVVQIVDAVGILDTQLTATQWMRIITDLVEITDPITVGGLIQFITDAYWGLDITPV